MNEPQEGNDLLSEWDINTGGLERVEVNGEDKTVVDHQKMRILMTCS